MQSFFFKRRNDNLRLWRWAVFELDSFFEFLVFLHAQVDWWVDWSNQGVCQLWIFLEEMIIVKKFFTELGLLWQFKSDLIDNHFGENVLLVVFFEVVLQDLQQNLEKFLLNQVFIDDASKQVSSDHKLSLWVTCVESQFRIHESDHASKQFLVFWFLGVFEFRHVLNCFFDRDLFFVNFSKLSFSHLLNFVRHLWFSHFWEVFANFFVNSFQTLKISLCHFGWWSRQKYWFKDKSQKLLTKLSLLKHELIRKRLLCFNQFSNRTKKMIFNVSKNWF